MGLFEVKQSLPLTLIFAVLAGLSLTLATACTHYPSYIDRQVEEQEASKLQEPSSSHDTRRSKSRNSFVDIPIHDSSPNSKYKKVTKGWWRRAYFANLTFASFAGMLQVVGTWFGPISLFSPIKMVSQIMSQLILFSYILKTEPYPSKNVRVGNYVIALSTVLIIFVGAKVSKDPISTDLTYPDDYDKLIFSAVILIITFGICFPFQLILGCTKLNTSDRVNFSILLVTEVMTSTIGNSCGKLLTLLSGTALYVNIGIFVAVAMSLAYAGILRSTVIVSQTKYLPPLLIFTIFMNGISGFILWDDEIRNLGGYIIAFLLFAEGTYLIMEYNVLPDSPLQDQIDVDEDHENVLVTKLVHGHARELYKKREERKLLMNPGEPDIEDLTDKMEELDGLWNSNQPDAQTLHDKMEELHGFWFRTLTGTTKEDDSIQTSTTTRSNTHV